MERGVLIGMAFNLLPYFVTFDTTHKETIMKDQYRKIARWYDMIFEPLNSGLRNIGIKMYPPKAGMAVLDIQLFKPHPMQVRMQESV